jgi:hypothetical protein
MRLLVSGLNSGVSAMYGYLEIEVLSMSLVIIQKGRPPLVGFDSCF